MANFAKDAAAALLGIVDPMVCRDVSGVDAITQHQRFVDLRYELLHPHRHGSGMAIQSEHQVTPSIRFLERGHNLTQFLLGETEWLFAENMFSRPCGC